MNLTSLRFISEKSFQEPVNLIPNEISKFNPFACVSDGTAFKAVAEYDPVTKANIGLTVYVGETFIEQNTPSDPAGLQKLLVTEVVVGCVTTLRNSTS